MMAFCSSSSENPAVKKLHDESSEDEMVKDEEERRKDLRERDEFADRLKKKDKEKTRQIMSKSDQKVII